MILTCPACATSYFVEDAALGQGRMVRCTSCGASWRATTAAPLELRTLPEEGAVAVPAREEIPSLGALPGEALPKVLRAKAAEQRKVREAATAGAVWAGIGATFAMVIVTALVFRVDVVRIVPRTAGAYAAVGLPVNRVGLTIEKIHAEPALQDGRAALAVSGVIRNIRTHPVAAPPLMIRILDKDGHKVASRTVRAGELLVAPGQTRDFAVSLLDPPATARDVEVTFQLDGWSPPKTGEVAAAGARRSAGLRTREISAPIAAPALAAVDASPLPADSPYALKPGVSASR